MFAVLKFMCKGVCARVLCVCMRVCLCFDVHFNENKTMAYYDNINDKDKSVCTCECLYVRVFVCVPYARARVCVMFVSV